MKNIRLSLRVIAGLMAIVMLATSCASTTLIRSEPSGAKLYLDGELAGRTPYTHTDTKITGSPTHVRITEDGYEEFQTVFVRNEEVDPGALVAGIFFWIPLLWIMKYKPVRTYELTPVPPPAE